MLKVHISVTRLLKTKMSYDDISISLPFGETCEMAHSLSVARTATNIIFPSGHFVV